MRRIVNLLVGVLICIPVFSQNLQFDPGKKYVSEDGLTSYSSEASLLKILNPMVYMNLVSREIGGDNEYFVVISLPVKTLDKVAEDSSLQLNLVNGETINLPVNERVVWDASKAPEKKSTEIYLINIPYKITKDQIDIISTTSVNKMSIPGIEKTVSFSIKGPTMSNVMKRQYQEVINLAGDGSTTRQSQNNSIAQARGSKSNNSTAVKLNIHETPATKVVYVQNMQNMILYPVREDAFFVYERGTGHTFVYNKNGEQLATIQLSYPDSYNNITPFGFSNDRAIVTFADGDMVIIDSKGHVVNDLNKVESLVTSKEYSQFNDGLALVYIAAKKRDRMDEFLTGYIPGDYFYLDDTGTIVRPDLPVKVDVVGGNRFVHPLRDGRRLHFDDKTGKYGFLDEKHKTAIPIQFVAASDFSDGLAAAAIQRGNETLWGFIDSKGAWVIEPMFSNQPKDFHEGYAIAKKKNGRYVYIDKTGKVCSEEYQGAFRFFNGLAMVLVDASNIMGYSPCFINSSFTRTSYSAPRINEYSKIEYCDNTKTFHFDGCLYSATGELLSKSVTPFYTDVTIYYEDGRPRGYVNLDGEIILKFVESEF